MYITPGHSTRSAVPSPFKPPPVNDWGYRLSIRIENCPTLFESARRRSPSLTRAIHIYPA